MHDWADTMCPRNGPSKESNTGSWDEVRFDSEEMSDLMDRKPDGWQRTRPEKEEAHEITGVSATTGNAIVQRVE